MEASVDTSAVYIGDIITYRLTITYDDGDSITAVPHGVNLYAFHVRDYRPIRRTRAKDGRWRQGDTYEITAYRPGTYVIPPIPIVYRTASGAAGELVTQPLTIEIKSLGVTEQDTLRGIKPPEAMPVKVRGWVWWALAGAGFVALAAAAFALWRRHRAREAEVLAQEPEVVDELAEFDKIAAEELIARGEIKELYVLVSEAMRRYIGRRYRIVAMELTHEELGQAMSQAHVSEGEVRLLLDFLDRCDLVKFARLIPPEDDVAALVERAKEIVQETQFRPAPSEKVSLSGTPERPELQPEQVAAEAAAADETRASAKPEAGRTGGER